MKADDDGLRWELYLLLLIVLVVTSWAVTAAYALRGGLELEIPVRAGETSEPVIFTGETGP